MNIAMARNIGYFLKGVVGLVTTTLTAGTAGSGTDEVYQDGAVIDRRTIEGLYLSCAVLSTLKVTGLGGSDTMSLQVKIMDAALAAGPFAAYAENNAVAYAANGTFVQSDSFDLSDARRFIRVSAKGLFDATTTDTLAVSSVVVVGSAAELPYVELAADEVS